MEHKEHGAPVECVAARIVLDQCAPLCMEEHMPPGIVVTLFDFVRVEVADAQQAAAVLYLPWRWASA